jgi:signal transduction histidine kinase
MSNDEGLADRSKRSTSEALPARKPVERRFVSLGAKLAGVTIALVAALTVIVYFEISANQWETLLRAKEMAASSVARIFADSAVAPLVFADEVTMKEAFATLARNDDVSYSAVWAVDDDGEMGDRMGELLRGHAVELTSVPLVLGIKREPDRLILSTPVRDREAKLVGAAVIAFSLNAENAAFADVRRRTLLLSAFAAVGLTLVLLLLARWTIVRPLAKLLLAANKIERGVASEIDIDSRDEIGQLASAFRSMAKAIKSREERIGARNRDLRLVLDNVDQGFLTLDHRGRVSQERSWIVDQWFGPPEPSMPFWKFLGRADAAAGEWFEVGWTAIADEILPLEICLQQLPRLVNHEGRALELAYRPIRRGDALDRVLVVITDATARIKRERAEIAQREALSIFQHILSNRAAFDQFFDEARTLVDAIRASDGSDLDALKRDIHTLKGNAAIFGLESVAGFCHELENELDQGSGEVTAQRKQVLLHLWDNLERVRAQFSRDGGIVIDRDEYRTFLEELRARAAHDVLLARFTSWQLEPASKRLGLVADQIRHLAARLGKVEVQVAIEPTRLRLPAKKWAGFWAAFTHLVRNAVDHGLEKPEERAAAGKSAQATISLSVAREGREVLVSIGDDGRGIDWERIAERATAFGLPHETPAELEASLFAPGISACADVTTTSGRGVGLSAVRDMVGELGGRIVVRSERGVGTVFRFYLPAAMLIEDPAEGARASLAPPPVDRTPALARN